MREAHVPKVNLTISLTDVPEALAGMRAEVAKIIRDVAEDEHPRVAKRLCEIADAFASGTRPEGY